MITRSRRLIGICRCYSVASAAAAETVPVSVEKLPQPAVLRAAVLLSRPPLITRKPSAFEAAVYEYQRNLETRLAATYPVDFYFKRGSIAEKQWLEAEAARKKNQLNRATPSPVELAHDATKEEETSGIMTTAEHEAIEMEELVHASEEIPEVSAADVHSLDRSLDRSLYLALKTTDSSAWVFPSTILGQGETLDVAGTRALVESCGDRMKIWFVGKVPVSIYKETLATDFFVKARILAGQSKIQSRAFADFGWFTKEELQNRISEALWEAIEPVLPSR